MKSKSLETLISNDEQQSSSSSIDYSTTGLEAHYATSWSCLQIVGPDTVDFLNRLLSIQVASIPTQQGSWAFLLDHRGRVQESIYLLRENQQSFIAVSETDAQALHDALDRFLFAENLNLSLRKDLRCVYSRFPTEHIAKGRLTESFAQSFYSISLLGYQSEYLSITSTESVSDFIQQHELRLIWEETDFEHERVRLGIAQPLREYQGRSPLDISTQGISEGKGCYPGQEVIERTLALGKPAKRTLAVKIFASPEDLKLICKSYGQEEILEVLSASLDEQPQAKVIGILSSLSTRLMHETEDKTMPFLYGIIQIKNRADDSNHMLIQIAGVLPQAVRIVISDASL